MTSTMARTFLVERYWPGVSTAEVERVAQRNSAVAAELRRRGVDIRYERSILVPEDETVICLFEAESPEAVAEAGRRADIPCDRVVHAVTVSPERLSPTEVEP